MKDIRTYRIRLLFIVILSLGLLFLSVILKLNPEIFHKLLDNQSAIVLSLTFVGGSIALIAIISYLNNGVTKYSSIIRQASTFNDNLKMGLISKVTDLQQAVDEITTKLNSNLPEKEQIQNLLKEKIDGITKEDIDNRIQQIIGITWNNSRIQTIGLDLEEIKKG